MHLDALERHKSRGERTARLGNAPVSDHVEDGAKFGGLAEGTRGLAVDRVEEARDAVCDGAIDGVVAHEMQGEAGENDTSVA